MTIPLTAKVLVPTAITAAMLTSCTVAEPAVGETLWVSGTTYALGDIRIRVETHKKYKRIIAGAGAVAPETDTTNWLDIGATNRWAQFDKKVGTTTNATSTVTTVIKPGSAEGIALLELTGTSATVSVKDSPGGATVYNCTTSLDDTAVVDVYDWMYADFLQKRNLILTDLPGQYPSMEVTVTVTSTTGSAIGVLAVGRVRTIGSCQYGAQAGILNWGKITDDGFGNREWIPGSYSARMTMPLVANRSDLDGLYRALADLRSTPSIYIATEITGFDPFICYGVYKDLYITVPDFATISLNLEIDGLNNA